MYFSIEVRNLKSDYICSLPSFHVMVTFRNRHNNITYDSSVACKPLGAALGGYFINGIVCLEQDLGNDVCIDLSHCLTMNEIPSLPKAVMDDQKRMHMEQHSMLTRLDSLEVNDNSIEKVLKEINDLLNKHALLLHQFERYSHTEDYKELRLDNMLIQWQRDFLILKQESNNLRKLSFVAGEATQVMNLKYNLELL